MQTRMDRSFAALRAVIVCAMVVVLVACGSRAVVPDDSKNVLGSVAAVTIHSTQTGATYPITIFLPASYAHGNETYPVIYATDGDATFPPRGRFVNFVDILQRHGTNAILVGIGGTSRRSTDFVLPGAIAYHAFVTQELIPFVESHFRADPKRRVLSGISLGGSFVMTSFFLEAPNGPSFSAYISTEGYFRQPAFVALEQDFARTMANKRIPATLFLARASASSTHELRSTGINGTSSIVATVNAARAVSNQGTNSSDVDALYRRMRERNYPDLVLIESQFDTDHIGADNPSFEEAVTRILK